jgi:hypothetical protein
MLFSPLTAAAQAARDAAQAVMAGPGRPEIGRAGPARDLRRRNVICYLPLQKHRDPWELPEMKMSTGSRPRHAATVSLTQTRRVAWRWGSVALCRVASRRVAGQPRVRGGGHRQVLCMIQLPSNLKEQQPESHDHSLKEPRIVMDIIKARSNRHHPHNPVIEDRAKTSIWLHLACWEIKFGQN